MSGFPEEVHAVGDDHVQEEFIENNEVEQEYVVDENAGAPMDDDDDEEDEGEEGPEEPIEIDMSNNSYTYFDKHSDSIFTVSQHPKLPLVCTGGGDNVAYLWTSHSQPPKFAGTITHSESVIAGDFSCDGKFLITADMNGQVLVHKAVKGGQQWNKCAELHEVEEVTWLKVHPTVAGIFAFGAVDGSVWCYQINSNSGSLEQLMSGFAHQQDCTMGEFVDVELGDTAVTLVTCSLDSTIVGWNCFTGQNLFKISQSELRGIEAPWVSLARAPASKSASVIACGANNGVLAIVNCQNGAVLQLSTVIELKPEQDELDASIESIAWSPKFPLLAIGLVSGEVLLYETQSWRVRHKFVLEDSVTKLKFESENGCFLFASCINGKVYEYDARNGQEVHVCLGHNMGVLDFVLSEDGKKLITAGDEGVSLLFQLP
ncbi:LAMI_0B04764g1_1 [Lachancea mirantina]|uniref:LAMI_0B04764g1_1 n=1 Tax=Lachancea mirantina TaxID=1230905 RepID=A0A1G4IVL2_9SACH|nr:LAMI_0B04764g1_1 [Lachancea mirantina]